MRRALEVLSVVLLAFLTATPTVWAGAQARIRGTIVDSAGKPVPGVVLTIRPEDSTEAGKAVEVGADGTFKALILDATKRWTIHAEAPGFIPYEDSFKVPAGSADNDFPITLTSEAEHQQELRASLEQQPGYRELGEARRLLAEDKVVEAEAKLEAAVAILPDYLEGWVALTKISFRAGHLERTASASRRCLELDATSLPCLAAGANAAKELGDEATYATLSARYRELNPDDPATIFNDAVPFLNAMDDEHARPLLERCLEADPDFAKCLYEYGMLLLRSGDIEGAKVRFKHYLEVAPDGEDAATVTDTLKYL